MAVSPTLVEAGRSETRSLALLETGMQPRLEIAYPLDREGGDEMSGRIIVVVGGGDWNDASCDHLSVPDGLDLVKVRKEYIRLYQSARDDRVRRWISFVEFLRQQPGVTEADVECIGDDI